jgi:hypothetical protein
MLKRTRIRTTPDAGEKSASEKSQDTRTSKKPFEKSSSQHTEYFVHAVKYKRTGISDDAEFTE